VKSKLIARSGILLAAGFLFTSSANALDMGKMINPMKWMKGSKNNDDYYDDGYGGPGYPPPGYGYGGPGYGGYGGPGYGGYGGPGYGGYGAPGYGGYGAPGYGGAPAYHTPQVGSSPDAAEISRLKERIRVLEEGNREIPEPSSYGGQQGYQQAPAYGGGQPGYQQAPAYGNPNPQYRPLNTN
jgi:hypothetical protein